MSAEDDFADEVAASRAAHMAEIARDAPVRWRQWAIEKLLASPTLAEAFAGRGIDIFTAADDVVAYVTTGVHPDDEVPTPSREDRP